MKRIDFIVAGIISSLWAIITCIYCGQGGTFSPDNHVDMWNGWYIPLPSKYWDWLYIGTLYIMVVAVIRGHWLPDWGDVGQNFVWSVFFLSTFFISAVIIIKMFGIEDMTLVLTGGCMTTYYRKDTPGFLVSMCTISFLGALFHGWAFAFFGTAVLITAKILIWLVVNTFRSGFTTALQQLRVSLVAGQKIVGETDCCQQPKPSKVQDGS